MKKKSIDLESKPPKGYLGEVLTSRARSAEILRVAKEMADKQHAETLRKLQEAPISQRVRKKILRMLNVKTR